MPRVCGPSLDNWFAYSTVKVVSIKDRRLGLLYYLIMLIITGYILGYVLIYSQGYYAFQFATGSVAVKIKGVAKMNNTIPGEETLTYFDAADLVWPPIETEGSFVITRMLVTRRQQLDWCPPVVPPINATYSNDSAILCTTDADCGMYVNEPGQSNVYPNDGRCMATTLKDNRTVNYCNYYQWCPAETEDGFVNPLNNEPVSIKQTINQTSLNDLTVWFKGNVRFDRLGTGSDVQFSTIQSNQTIKYNPADPSANANLYSLGNIVWDLLPGVQGNQEVLDNLLNFGALIKITLDWKCYITSQKFSTTYTARRLDSPDPSQGGGFNYRTARYYYSNDTETGALQRDLLKYSGLRFYFESSGTGMRWSLIQVMLTVASAVALYGGASVIVDLLAIRLLPERQTYRSLKVQQSEVLYHAKDEEVDEEVAQKTDEKKHLLYAA